MVLWQVVLLVSLWPLSFWYLLRFEKKSLIDRIDSESSGVTAIVVLNSPLIAVWLGFKRWNEWSFG